MNSKQEELIHKLSEHSLGSPFIFAPSIYEKGKAQREPADLVWACNNVIILLYMKGKKEDSKSASEIIQNRREKLIEANFIQARGWLSEWRSGRELIGKNNHQDFIIKHNQYKYTIVLGIIDYGQEEGLYHSDYAEEFGVNMCATFSQKSLEYIVAIGCTLIDIIKLLLILKNDSQNKLKISLMDFVKGYHFQAVKKADPNKICFRAEGNKMFRWVDNYQRALRSMANAIPIEPKNNASAELSSILNDIDLEDFLYFNVYLSNLLEEVGTNYGYCTVRAIGLKKYVIILGVASNGNFPLMAKPMTEALKTLSSKQTTISILYEIQMGAPIVSFYPRSTESEVEEILSKIFD